MSQAETLLETLAMNVAQHAHPVVDSDSYYTIDPISKTISNGRGSKKVIMQYDHNSERITFALPRFVDGHDMLLCNRVRVHWNNIDSSTGQENAETYEVDDLRINSEDDATVICSWAISRNSTQLVGILSFLVQYECVENGESVYEWHSDIYSDLEVKEGRNNSEQSIIEYTDILEQWRAKLFGAGDTVIEEISTASESQKAAIEAKGAETLATIPEDFTATYNMADRALRTRANAIVLTAEGEIVVATDCSEDYLRGLHIYGRTTQDGIPTPENPVDLVSVNNIGIALTGKNLIDINSITPSTNKSVTVSDGYTLTVVGGSGGTYTYSYYNMPTKLVYALRGKRLVLSADSMSKSLDNVYSPVQLNIICAGGNHKYPAIHENNLSYEFEVPTDANSIRMGVYTNNSSKVLESDNTVVVSGLRIMLVGNSEYEAYRSLQTIDISRTLRGIPVTSGGNYTDSNGQQWICDEIDFERGVYIQRIHERVFNGTESWIVSEYQYDGDGVRYDYRDTSGPAQLLSICLSTHFQSDGITRVGMWVNSDQTKYAEFRIRWTYDTVDDLKAYLAEQYAAGTPVNCIYALRTPIETPLSDAEKFAFSLLHSNYPTTTVLNTENAYMSLDYNADTKTFITNLIRDTLSN